MNIYINGYGVVKNDLKAAQWYLKAANKGYPHGLDRVKTLLTKLAKDGNSSSFAALIKIADSKVIRQVVNLEIDQQWAVEQEHWKVVAVLLEHYLYSVDAKIFVNIMTNRNQESNPYDFPKDENEHDALLVRRYLMRRMISDYFLLREYIDTKDMEATETTLNLFNETPHGMRPGDTWLSTAAWMGNAFILNHLQ